MIGVIREQVIKRFGRSSKWGKTRKAHLKREKVCACCGRKKGLQVHHIVPFSVNPLLELDKDNLMTMCGRCHLLIGHLNYWKSYNAHLREDAIMIKERIKGRP